MLFLTTKTKELTFLLCSSKSTHYLSINTPHSKLIWILSMERDFFISWAITEFTGSLEMWVSVVLCRLLDLHYWDSALLGIRS